MKLLLEYQFIGKSSRSDNCSSVTVPGARKKSIVLNYKY